MIEIRQVLEERKSFYEFLAEVFLSGVPRKFIEDVRKGVFSLPHAKNKEIEAGFREIFERINEVGSIEELEQDVEDEYVRLFLGPGEAEVLPYQSVYEGHVVYGETTLKLKSIYGNAGLRTSRAAGVGDDHLGVQLKFMAHLCERARDLLLQGENPKQTLEMQKEFLEGNLLPWAQKFCENLIGSANFYRGVAMVTRGFLNEDRVALRELLARL